MKSQSIARVLLRLGCGLACLFICLVVSAGDPPAGGAPLRVPEQMLRGPQRVTASDFEFELAGPRARLFFDPGQARAGIVACGGLCPGLNDVIRSIYLELHHAYGVKEVLGFL